MLDKLERKIGKYAVKNLIYYILAAYALGYVCYFIEMGGSVPIYDYLMLDPYLVMHGQVWRLITWICTIPGHTFSIFFIFIFILYFFIGRTLERTLGTFKYNVFMISGWLFTTLGAMIMYWIWAGIYPNAGEVVGTYAGYEISTYFINLSSFLLFAVLFPETKVLLMGILPVKIKWLAIIDGIYILYYLYVYVYNIIAGYVQKEALYYIEGICGVVVVLISLLNFALFFLMTHKLSRFKPSEVKRRADYKKKVNNGKAAGAAFVSGQSNSKKRAPKAKTVKYRPAPDEERIHKCAVCGRDSKEYPDLQFRYCTKCNGNFEYCQDHLFTHKHVE